MPAGQADRNLLLGILAYQNAFVSKDALLTGMQAWLFDKSVPLAQVLQNQGALNAERRTLLDALVLQHLKQHGDDPQRSLNALSSAGSVRQDLERLGDQDVHASLAHVSAGMEADPWATAAQSAGASRSAGMRFRILRPHARGGLGEVFVALDQELNREVALKEIQERHADDRNSRGRFVLEAEITGGLEHPGIVPVYGLGAYADGRPFYAMRFIRGDSLQEAIERFHKKLTAENAEERRGSSLRLSAHSAVEFAGLDFRQLLGRFVDVCNAIAYAHSRGVLHRDLKPANIMLGKYGETLVVDWGLAKCSSLAPREERDSVPSGPSSSARDTAANLSRSETDTIDEPPLRPSSSGSAETVAGSAIGTPAFMSPEQAEGRLDLLGPASDVYSLGATLYCLLTGRPPADGPVDEVLKKVRTGDIAPPRRLNAAIDPALEAACLKAMSLRPQDRYATPKALADDLEKWLAGEPVSAWPEPWTVTARRWIGKHRTLVTGAAAAVLVTMIASIVVSALLGGLNHQLAESNEELTKARNEALQAADSLSHQKNIETIAAEENRVVNTIGFLMLTEDEESTFYHIVRKFLMMVLLSRIALPYSDSEDTQKLVLDSWIGLKSQLEDGSRTKAADWWKGFLSGPDMAGPIAVITSKSKSMAERRKGLLEVGQTTRAVIVEHKEAIPDHLQKLLPQLERHALNAANTLCAAAKEGRSLDKQSLDRDRFWRAYCELKLFGDERLHAWMVPFGSHLEKWEQQGGARASTDVMEGLQKSFQDAQQR